MSIAFFDMDKTLLTKSSGLLYVKYLLGRRLIKLDEVVNVLVISTQYSLNFLNFPRAIARMSRRIKGGDATATKRLTDQWFEDSLIHYIAPKAVERVREHEKRGDQPLLLSASSQFAVEPVARYLNIPYCCTELEIVNNRFTGKVVGMHCYAEGKKYWGERIARERGADIQDCTFYSDSYSDHWLMDVVGRPVAVNPDRKLAALARAKGWPIEYFY
ncbi:MAG: HAD family phosphatase [Chloroflexi bacterium]|nr:HAD family phosphatase [Chloroflexota bacterium]MCL5273747.1 HAD family phosphatase [Chloroflexota bacterium]